MSASCLNAEEKIYSSCFSCLAFINTYRTSDYCEKGKCYLATANNPQLCTFPIWLVKSTKQNSRKSMFTRLIFFFFFQSCYVLMLDFHLSRVNTLMQHEVMHWESVEVFTCVITLEKSESSYLNCSGLYK